MAINPAQIELTPEQKQRLAERAELAGEDYSTLVDEWLGLSIGRSIDANGELTGSMLDAMKAAGAWGCFSGPGDLSTNPKYMEGFGINANRPLDTD